MDLSKPLAEKLVGFEDADEIDQLINLLSTNPSLAQAIDPPAPEAASAPTTSRGRPSVCSRSTASRS